MNQTREYNINIYVSNIGAPKYIKQILTDIKGEIDSNTIIVGNFNTPLTSIYRSSRQKINMEILASNNTLDEIDKHAKYSKSYQVSFLTTVV